MIRFYIDLNSFFKNKTHGSHRRSASAAVYGTRTVAQETFFQQHGGTLRNSGIPNHQDSAFLLPSKARHRLQKHGVNLLWAPPPPRGGALYGTIPLNVPFCLYSLIFIHNCWKNWAFFHTNIKNKTSIFFQTFFSTIYHFSFYSWLRKIQV